MWKILRVCKNWRPDMGKYVNNYERFVKTDLPQCLAFNYLGTPIHHGGRCKAEV